MTNTSLRHDFLTGLKLTMVFVVLAAPAYLLVECSPERMPMPATEVANHAR
jgi:hypothetical protein